MAGEGMLKIEELSKRYGRLLALDRVTFGAGPGEVLALLGPNGAGKTTAFKCILGVTGFEGTIRVAGLCPAGDGKEVRRCIGYLPQAPAFDSGDTCRDVLRFLSELRGVPPHRADQLLERVRLDQQAGTRVGHLSGGMRQRLALAAALLSDPPLLLLDEPTANLDDGSRELFHELLSELKGEGKTILLSTHFVEALEALADRVVVLRQGRVALDRATSDLVRRHSRRFLVNLNGTDPAQFAAALAAIGVGPERISPAGDRLQAALADAVAGREGER